jgi:hypothetical protein
MRGQCDYNKIENESKKNIMCNIYTLWILIPILTRVI